MGKFKVTREVAGNHLIAHLEGVLDGSVDFAREIGAVPERLTLDCERVYHVNSSLVQPWVAYFDALSAQGVTLGFRNCPSPVIEYFSAVPRLLCGGRVESVIAPFYCKTCKKERPVPMEITTREEALASLDSRSCTGCKGVLLFDDDPDTYFQFIRA